MKVALVRIGNSRGVRIPKPVIQQCGFGDTVSRAGWEEAFRIAGTAANDELLLDTLSPNEFDREDWRW